MNVWGVTFGGYLAKILIFKSVNLLFNSNFCLLSEGTVQLTIQLNKLTIKNCECPIDELETYQPHVQTLSQL